MDDRNRDAILAMATSVIQRHGVMVGPVDTVLLTQYGRYRTPHEVNGHFEGHLAPGAPFRRDIVALARANASPWSLTEVPLKIFNPKSRVSCPPVLDNPQWQLDRGGQTDILFPKEQGVRLRLGVFRRQSAILAINGSRAREWRRAIGTLRSQEDLVFPADSLTVLVKCSLLAERTLMVLIATPAGPALMQYAFSRDSQGKMHISDLRDTIEPRYILGTDAKGRVRCFSPA